jgi:hypothetical protein
LPTMKCIVVHTKTQAKDWLQMPLRIYKNDPMYIRPLDKDIEDVFDADKNKFYKSGECERWLFVNEQGDYVARIAVFVNKKYKQTQPTGGIGFFECVNDKTVAHQIFDLAKTWLQARGMQAMDGPINFGERDRWWGCLIDGFDEPLYCMNYNPSYYQALLESYGFQIYFNQLCFGMEKKDGLAERFVTRAEYYFADKNFEVRHIQKNKMDSYAEDFCTVYNDAFASHGEGKSMDLRVAKKMFQTMKPIMDEKIAYFVYYKNEPIAMWLNLPDLNQYFKHFDGKFGIIQKLRLLYMQRFQKGNRFLGVVYGVCKAWQGKGVDAMMMVKCRDYVYKMGAYDKYEMQWIGDFNPKMINLAHNLNAKEVRRLATFRYLFDRNKEFVRMGSLG